MWLWRLTAPLSLSANNNKEKYSYTQCCEDDTDPGKNKQTLLSPHHCPQKIMSFVAVIENCGNLATQEQRLSQI